MKDWLLPVILALSLSLAIGTACDDDDGGANGEVDGVPTATQPSATTAVLYYGNNQLDPDRPDCSVVFPTERSVPDADPETALAALFAGPTDEEAADGYVSEFSEATASMLVSFRVEGDTAYIDLTDFREVIPNVSSSCGSATFFAEVETTLGEVTPATRFIYAIEGDPEPFYEFMQIGCNEANDNCDTAPFE